ncbi:hypothetical protein BDZ90DRAFT_135724 [Jaminaea rosea]|uniref:RAVE complex protein Rav1 C-terminal domain-containing protein n=1 Tax=Jaminaea rosea TaxID=1569628 RepID=A0A316V0L0_9BASI|nr:hypothetical protein BDZ90DRAFT_135724 [Jaminaea rosea]PWN28975.1 hypothetical protein BDZ90DRAFT_135724 [Jaminaea rosea]
MQQTLPTATLLLSHTAHPRSSSSIHDVAPSSSSSSSSSWSSSSSVSHCLSPDGRRLVLARSSACSIVLLNGRYEPYHHLDFWSGFPSVTPEERKAHRNVTALRVRGTTAGEAAGSDGTEQALILAALGTRLVIWSSASIASNSPKSWRIHSTLSLSDSIHSLDLHADRLLLGVGNEVQIWSMGDSGGHFWRKVWSKRGPGSMGHVEFNATGSSFAAAACGDRRIAVWHLGRRKGSEPVKGCMLAHAMEVKGFRWRGMPAATSQSDALVSLAEDRVARIWAPVIDQPSKLRLSASIDPFSLGGFNAANSSSVSSRPLEQPVFYLDAAVTTSVLTSNIALLQRDLQLAETDTTTSQSHSPDLDKKCTRLKRLQHLLEDTPDMFLRLNSDGSLVIRAVAHVDRRPPTLLQAFTVLKIFPSPAALPSLKCELVQCELLPMATQLGQSHEAPLAVLHLQSEKAGALSIDVNPALLFDGMERGLATKEGSQVQGHGSEIVALLGTEEKETVVTVDEEGLAVEWRVGRRPYVTLDGKREARWTLQGRKHRLAPASTMAKGKVIAAMSDNVLSWQSSRLVLCSAAGPKELQGLQAEEGVIHGGLDSSFAWVITDKGRSLSWRLNPADASEIDTPVICQLVDESLSCVFAPSSTSSSATQVSTISSKGSLRLWQQSDPPSWTCKRVVETGLQDVNIGAVSQRGMVALAASTLESTTGLSSSQAPAHQHHLEIWDAVASEFSSSRQLSLNRGPEAIVMMEWLDSSEAAGGAEVLAVATSTGRIDIFAKCRPSMLGAYGDSGSQWRIFATFDIAYLSSEQITGIKWASHAGALLIACGQSLHLVGPLITSDTGNGAVSHLLESVAQEQNALPSYHPTVLLQCMLWGKFDAAKRVVSDLARAVRHIEAVEDLSLREDVHDLTVEEILESHLEDAEGKYQRHNGSAHRSLFDDEQAGSTSPANGAFHREVVSDLNEKLAKLGRLPDMTIAEVDQLILANKCLLEVTEQGRALDDNGLRFLVSLRIFLNNTAGAAGLSTVNSATSFLSPKTANGSTASAATTDPFDLPRLRHRDFVYALHSTCQEPLLAHVSSAYSSKLPWHVARSTGLFLWLTSAHAISPLAEQVARDTFMSSPDRDPIPCSLFYYALGKHKLVLNLWRQAAWHPEQKKMLRFLANDFSEERWKSAALKNAYALLSQRRFVFAASFFLLADSLGDAVNVCVRNLGDVHLALALCRVKEQGSFDGPVMSRLLRTRLLPLVFERGYRWLGHWVFWTLKARDLATRVLVSPLSELREDPRVVALLNTVDTGSSLSKFSFSASSTPPRQEDVSLAIFFADMKRKTVLTAKGSREVSPAKEWGFVLHMNRTLRAMGCHIIGLALLAGWDFDAPMLPQPPVEATSGVGADEPISPARPTSAAASASAVRTDANDLFAALSERPVSPPPPPAGSRGHNLLESAVNLTEEPEAAESLASTSQPVKGTSDYSRRRSSRADQVTSPTSPTSPTRERTRPPLSPQHRRRSSLLMVQRRRRSMVNDADIEGSSEADKSTIAVPEESSDGQVQTQSVNEAENGQEEKKKKGQGLLMKASSNAASQGAQDFDFSNFGF